jgi:hypothetical protein
MKKLIVLILLFGINLHSFSIIPIPIVVGKSSNSSDKIIVEKYIKNNNYFFKIEVNNEIITKEVTYQTFKKYKTGDNLTPISSKIIKYILYFLIIVSLYLCFLLIKIMVSNI